MMKANFSVAIRSAVAAAITLLSCTYYGQPSFADQIIWPKIHKTKGAMVPETCIAEVHKLQSQGTDEEIIKLLNLCLKDRPDVAALYFYRAQALIKLKRYKEALFDCTAQIKLEPRIYKPYEMRARCYLAMKDRMKAFSDCKRVVELEPDNAYAHEQLALYYKQEGDLSKWKREMVLFKSTKGAGANESIPAVLARHDHPFSTLLEKAQSDLAHNKPGLVLDGCKQILSFSDQDIAVEHVSRGDIYEMQAEAFQQMDIHDQAVVALNQVLKYQPKNKRACYLRAKSYFALGKYDKCLADCDKAGQGDKILSDTVAQLRAKAVSHLKRQSGLR